MTSRGPAGAPPPDGVRDSDFAYQAQALEAVSRTFALTIPRLPDPLRTVVGNAYLLCRINDTIEDDPGLSPAQKAGFWERFVEVVQGRGDPADFAADLGAELSASTPSGEHDLIANTARVVRVTRVFPARQRHILSRCVGVMSRGMSEFQNLDTSRGVPSLREFHRYCYFVAGVVGEMLTELFCEHAAEIEERRGELLPLAVSFGQGLQMTNILKDVWEDLRRGACWLPRDVFRAAGFDLSHLRPEHGDPAFVEGMTELVGIARGHLDRALRFVELLPARETGIRSHCLWALGMAVLTLRRIHQTPWFRRGRDVKISRRTVRGVILVTNSLVRSNFALRRLFAAMTRGLPLPRLALSDGVALGALPH